MPNTDLNKLIQELMTVHERVTSKATPKGPFFILARLVHGMDKKSWTELCAKSSHTNWCALEVHNNPPSLQVAKLPIETNDELTDNLLIAHFMKQLEREVARTIRSNAPLAVVCFTVLKQNKNTSNNSIDILLKAIEQNTNICDFFGGISQDEFGLILPGAKSFKAQNVAEDIIDFCTKQGLSIRAGIASCTGKTCQSTTLFQQAQQAAQNMQNTGAQVFKNPSIDLDATLVHSHEKRFLFGGN